MGNRRRARTLREVKAVTLAQIGDIAGSDRTDVTALVSGLSSLLHLGLHFAFFPADGKRPDDADFAAGNEFSIFGWTADERGERVQLDSEAVSGATPLQAPGGWAGRTELDQLELRASVTPIGTAGDWRLIVVLEPADGCICEELFLALVSEVDIVPGIRPPAVVQGVP